MIELRLQQVVSGRPPTTIMRPAGLGAQPVPLAYHRRCRRYCRREARCSRLHATVALSVLPLLIFGGAQVHTRFIGRTTAVERRGVQFGRAPHAGERYYWGEEDWDRPPSPPSPDLPPLDTDGCFTQLQQQGYAVVASCSQPSNVRPAGGGGVPGESGPVLQVNGACVFVADDRCCEQADGLLWDVRFRGNLKYSAARLADLRQANPHQVWIAESTETYQSKLKRPLINPNVMKHMDYVAYWGLSADYPLLPNYDYRNQVHRDLLAWPGRNVTFQASESLSDLLAAKTGGVLYLSSYCTGNRKANFRGSGRDSFVRRMMTYLHVDSLGACLNNAQADAHDSGTPFRASAADLIAKYKFRVVLPNSLCEDYVVEKFSQTVLHATIPIFLGAPSGKNFDPGLAAGVHPAAIHVADFEGFEQLVEHIVHVAQVLAGALDGTSLYRSISPYFVDNCPATNRIRRRTCGTSSGSVKRPRRGRRTTTLCTAVGRAPRVYFSTRVSARWGASVPFLSRQMSQISQIIARGRGRLTCSTIWDTRRVDGKPTHTTQHHH
jgi:hypothetical protein